MDRTKVMKLAESSGGLFRLAVLLQKRVQELVNGAPKLVKTDESDPINIAMMEVEADAIDAALRRESFVNVAADRGLRTRLAAVGMIGDSAATSPAAFGFAAREVLERVGPRLRRLREDPELHQLAADPEVVYLLEQGQVLGLLQHPGFQRVVARVLSDEATL